MNKKVLFICHAAMIAALYVVLTVVASSLNLANGNIQVRFSEALTILPFFTPAAIPGLAIGCLISNLITGCVPLDIVFGTVATLLGALGSYALRRYKWLVPLPPILANAIIVPWVLRIGYGMPLSIPFMMLTVGAGEVISCYILGMILLLALEKSGKVLFK
ncbi:MAG: QueT transporter family protein [Eubacterium sp.]|nr:QueT transporter family protein [Eubacterium sp.]